MIPDTKCQKVREALTCFIRSGKFRPGTRLPGERELARSLNVSTMTVNRAISEMVDAQWLERRPRVGTFVHTEAWQTLSTKFLNLITPLYDHPIIQQFYRFTNAMAREKGFTPREIRFGKDSAEAVNAILDGSYSLIFMPLTLESLIAQAAKQMAGRVVLLSGRLDAIGIHSVMGDDRHMIRMGMEYLRRLGHERIGLMCCRMENYVERERVAAWHACHGSEARSPELQQRLIVLNLPLGEHPMELAYKVMRDFLKTKDRHRTTAMILPDDETAMVALSACRDEGISVPGDLSLISIGNTLYAEHLTPKLTSLDPNLEVEIALALDILSDRNVSVKETGLLHAVEPKLVVRESTGPVPEK